ncbi:MAG: class II aldolase/adducin family protein [Bauldia sp.]|nr:class II aldolase/adducin family protein [Bauldia sp.]
MVIRDDPEFSALLRLSAELGRDPLRTQAAGGNTSLKRDGVLWIKASGKWLAEAEDNNVMVPVELDRLLAALAAGDERAETATAFVKDGLNPGGLRPSVETPVHAVIPWPVVIHIHCVATIAVAVRKDAESLLAERLRPVAGVRWAFIPYIRPGVPLSRAVAAVAPGINVIVLGNHGLVVGAATVAEASVMLDRVRDALDTRRRRGGEADAGGLMRLAEGSPYRLPRDALAHDVATDAASLTIARSGTLYPDHVVFLGPGILTLDAGATPAAIADRFASAGRQPPPMLVVPRRGLLLHRDALRGADELARALAEVTGRIAPGAELTCISPEQEAELVNWDAEKYRLSLAGGGRADRAGSTGN